jgi:hypothetical protein
MHGPAAGVAGFSAAPPMERRCDRAFADLVVKIAVENPYVSASIDGNF